MAAVIYILSSPVFAIFLSKSIDYKFTRENDENILKNRYKMQLLLYKQAIEKAENIKIDKVYLISLLNKKIIIFLKLFDKLLVFYFLLCYTMKVKEKKL